jgi:hypothetical protein
MRRAKVRRVIWAGPFRRLDQFGVVLQNRADALGAVRHPDPGRGRQCLSRQRAARAADGNLRGLMPLRVRPLLLWPPAGAPQRGMTSGSIILLPGWIGNNAYALGHDPVQVAARHLHGLAGGSAGMDEAVLGGKLFEEAHVLDIVLRPEPIRALSTRSIHPHLVLGDGRVARSATVAMMAQNKGMAQRHQRADFCG